MVVCFVFWEDCVFWGSEVSLEVILVDRGGCKWRS